MRDVLRKGVILIALLVAVGFYAFFAPALVEMFLGQSSDVLSILLSAVVGIFAYVLFRFVLNKGLSVLDKKILSLNVSLVAGYFFSFFFASSGSSRANFSAGSSTLRACGSSEICLEYPISARGDVW